MDLSGEELVVGLQLRLYVADVVIVHVSEFPVLLQLRLHSQSQACIGLSVGLSLVEVVDLVFVDVVLPRKSSVLKNRHELVGLVLVRLQLCLLCFFAKVDVDLAQVDVLFDYAVEVRLGVHICVVHFQVPTSGVVRALRRIRVVVFVFRLGLLLAWSIVGRG